MPRTPYMLLRLADGASRLVPISDWDAAEKALLSGKGPFSGRWIRTVGGSLVQSSQVVEARRVDLDDDEVQKLPD